MSTALDTMSDAPVGLEDVDASDMRIPRVTIDHKTGEFVDSLTNERTAVLKCVVLGLVKQRVLWPATMGTGEDPPLCKSLDHVSGRPGPGFPWEAAGFTESAATTAPDGAVVLPCESCALAQWDSHPTNKTPWCSEQFVLAILRPNSDGTVSPGLVTFQRSGMKSCKQYVSSFKAAAQPMFVVGTEITLKLESKGTVSYAVPTFTKGRPVPESKWPEFAENYRNIRTFLQTPPKREDDGGATGVPGIPPRPPTAPSTPAAEPVPVGATATAAAPVAVEPVEDDGLPW